MRWPAIARAERGKPDELTSDIVRPRGVVPSAGEEGEARTLPPDGGERPGVFVRGTGEPGDMTENDMTCCCEVRRPGDLAFLGGVPLAVPFSATTGRSEPSNVLLSKI